jgi:hypothetical protein
VDVNQTFWLLDKHASEFNFPVLDNAHVQLGATRLTAFHSPTDWLIVFETLGFSVPQGEFVNGLYAYGSCVVLGGFVGEEILFKSAPELPLFDEETNKCIADWANWAISIHNRTRHFTPTLDEYAEAGIRIENNPGRGTLTEVDLLRYVVFHLGKQLFLEDATLLSHFPKCKGLSKFIQTTEWQHPDVAGGEKPSENVSIRSLIEALDRGEPSSFDPGRPNTGWKSWVAGGRP